MGDCLKKDSFSVNKEVVCTCFDGLCSKLNENIETVSEGENSSIYICKKCSAYWMYTPKEGWEFLVFRD